MENNKEFEPPRNCTTCKYMWMPMYNGPCRDCVHNSCLGKENLQDRWEQMEE